ncbi:outer membrane biogenesis protein BamB [Posidoniimonas corsicana]|uniref:Outer membrane biogenesis protein BamB n=1 Tax=Posidoniimonas corsicana TaxID=1938618 RepID=A0A5C5UXD6_9BACT|nr:PQQ-binding-like beta-propeller repeat protein [Posidoniimonas corsicana]TWT31006.1 outer membrane biogenesis protein BamB [Posidoniimonas corsicana]
MNRVPGVLLLLLLASPVLVAEDWIGFRGGDHFGAAKTTELPTEWGDQQNIVWKRELPGPGSSCPVLIGQRVYLTCYSGYGENAEDPGEQSSLVRHVVCLDRDSGAPLWKKDFPAKLPESKYQPGFDSMHGYATSTLTSDGERLYAFFGVSGVYCLDMEGNQIWQADVGDKTHGWGSGASPVVHGDIVIVNASIESNSLVGLDKHTGEEKWRVEGIDSCWATPLLVEANGRTEAVLNVPRRLTSYDPATGEELWHCNGVDDGYLCPSIIAVDGVVYATGARRNQSLAVPAGGSGDMSEKVLWRIDKGSNVNSLVYHDGYLYLLHDKNGVAYCVDAKSGELMYEERLRPRPDIMYASATAADGKIYASSRFDGTFVLKATPDELEQLVVNTFESDDSRVNAAMAVGEGRLFLRTDKAIYCIGAE